MALESQRRCDTAWTTEEIVENANKWSLAGDVALLNTIKLFSKNMLEKTEKLSLNIDKLLNNIDEVGLKLDISQNQFHSLKNTQFIENRVYEDDETLDSKEEEKVVEKPPSKEDQEKIITESVISGLEILNKYYDMVEVSISDSDEEEESARSFILKPKDTYANRPLPPVIGTDEWYKRWNTEESSSDSEDDKVADIYSESDSEDILHKDLFKGSETSSELDFSSHTSENRLVANSTSNGFAGRQQLVTSGENNEETSPVNMSIASKSFAEQLAAKLDSVINTEDISSQINRERIQPAKSNTFCGNLFPDEPPPLSESEDIIFPKSASAGIFSGGERLFDDIDFVSHENRSKISPHENENPKLREDQQRTENARQDINKTMSFLPKSSKVSKGLFDSDDSSDDDIFSSSRIQINKPAFLQPSKPTVPLFDNEPPKLTDEDNSTQDILKKKPAGGVAIFGNSNIFGNDEMRNVLKNQQKSFAIDLFEESEKNTNSPEFVTSKEITKKEAQINQKKINLFEDDADDSSFLEFKKERMLRNNLFVDDDIETERKIPIKKEPSKSKNNLFEDDNIGTERKIPIKNEPSESKADAEEIAEDEDSYDKVVIEKEPLKNVNLFDDEFHNVNLPPKKTNISLFSDDDELFKDDLFSEISTKKFKSNLFDDLQNSNGLFGIETDNGNNTVDSDDFKNKKDVVTKEDLKTDEISFTPVLEVEDKLEFDDNIDVSVKEDNLNNNGLSRRNEANSVMDDFMVRDYKKTQANDNKVFEKHGHNPYGSGNGIAAHSLLEKETTPKYDSITHSNEEEKVIVKLFDSTPPPDDDFGDWDTKSDSFSDTEDYTPYHVDDNLQRSSLFDDEPPSLGPNESSSIIRDNIIRVDDAPFHPYASSSRKPSSDIFSDEQSQDYSIVTKSEVESTTTPLNLGIILEDSKTNEVNISGGNLKDSNFTQQTEILDSGNDLFGDEESQSHRNNIFDEETVLESAKKEQDKSEILSNENEKHDVENGLSKQTNDITRSPTEETGSENEMKLPQKKSTILSITEMFKSELENKTPETKVSPGKLKHSMNINVNALLPGYAPQKVRELTKSQSLDSPKEEDWRFEKPQVAHTSSTSAVRKNLSGTALETAVSFDEVDNVEVLHSVTKDRAKLPLNRRPSTRRGRQAAIRKSVIDNDSVSNNERPQGREVEDTSDNLEISTRNVQMEINSTEDEITKEKSPETIQEVTKHHDIMQQNSSKAGDKSDKNKALFESGSESDNELFNPTQKKSKKETNLKKSLFDDVSSDEDLFSSVRSASFAKNESASKSLQRRVQKPAPVKKLENIQTSEDPLSDLFK